MNLFKLRLILFGMITYTILAGILSIAILTLSVLVYLTI